MHGQHARSMHAACTQQAIMHGAGQHARRRTTRSSAAASRPCTARSARWNLLMVWRSVRRAVSMRHNGSDTGRLGHHPPTSCAAVENTGWPGETSKSRTCVANGRAGAGRCRGCESTGSQSAPPRSTGYGGKAHLPVVTPHIEYVGVHGLPTQRVRGQS